MKIPDPSFSSVQKSKSNSRTYYGRNKTENTATPWYKHIRRAGILNMVSFKPASSKMVTLEPEEGPGCGTASVLGFQNRLGVSVWKMKK